MSAPVSVPALDKVNPSGNKPGGVSALKVYGAVPPLAVMVLL